MTFKFSHITDIHIGSYQGKEEVGGLNSRYVDFVKTYNEAIDYTIEKKMDFCLITGDCFKDKHPKSYELHSFCLGIKKLIDSKIKVVIVLGNHDIILGELLHNTISVLQIFELENIIISSKPEILKIPVRDGFVQIQTMPYQSKTILKMENNKEVSDFMVNSINILYNTRDKSLPIVFAGHFSIEDSLIGTEQQTINRFNEPIISKEIFKDKDYVYVAMGHLHKFQILLDSPLIIYGGSLNRIDFNEAKEDKGFVHIVYDGKTHYKFVKVNARKFVDLNYDLSSQSDPEGFLIKELESRKEEIKDSIVRLYVSLSEENKLKYGSKNISETLNKHVNFIQGNCIPHVIKKSEITQDNAGFNEFIHPLDALKQYSIVNKIERKEDFIKLGEEIIKEVLFKK